MPELPEVEMTRLMLEAAIARTTIKGVEVRESRFRKPIDETTLTSCAGDTFIGFDRRGKHLLMRLASGKTLHVHLGMTGRLRVKSSTEAVAKHDHVLIYLDNQTTLTFNDPRRFGLMAVAEVGDSGSQRLEGNNLGPEPLSVADLAGHYELKAKGKRTVIKYYLLDQRTVAGLGNICVNETLFRARLHPASRIDKLKATHWQALALATTAHLNYALEAGRDQLASFIAGELDPSTFKIKLYVYDREGESCRVCGREIRKLTQNNRPSYYCASCQPENLL